MSIRVRDPLAEVNKAPEGKPLRRLETLEGKRMGLVWNQQAATVEFWPVFEQVVEKKLRPTEIHRHYKKGTWNPVPAADIADLAQKADYVIVGVGS